MYSNSTAGRETEVGAVGSSNDSWVVSIAADTGTGLWVGVAIDGTGHEGDARDNRLELHDECDVWTRCK